MLQNQLGRRNLNDFQRVEIVSKYEATVKAQAKERQGTRNDLLSSADEGDNIQVNLPECSQSRDELGAMAGVSRSTYDHATKVLANAPAPIVEAARHNELSINTAYGVTKLPEDQQAEIAERIEQGEAAKSVISEVKSRNCKSAPATQTSTADDVSPQTTLSETSQRHDDGIAPNVSPDTNAKELPPKESIIPTTDIPTIQPEEQEEDTKDVVDELAHSETQAEPQTSSETVEDVTIPSAPETLQYMRIEEYEECATEQDDYYDEEPPYDDGYDHYDSEEEEESTRIDIFKTRNSYNIIYAAPTWENGQSAEELLKLPVWRVADENCALLLWVKGSLMSEALKVIDRWGFKYRTVVFVWVKRTQDDEGKLLISWDKTSDWTCESCEFCLLAIRGTVQRVKDDVPQLVKHIMKDEGINAEFFKEQTVELLGDLPALELFPDIDLLRDEKQFGITYAEWDMAAPKWFLEQRAEEKLLERNREALGTLD